MHTYLTISQFVRNQILPLSLKTALLIAVALPLFFFGAAVSSQEGIAEPEESKLCREAVSDVLANGTKVDQPLKNQILFNLTSSQHRTMSINELDWSDDELREGQRPAILMKEQGFRSTPYQLTMCWVTLNTSEFSECSVGMLRETDADIDRYGNGPLIMETGYQPRCAGLLEDPLNFLAGARRR